MNYRFINNSIILNYRHFEIYSVVVNHVAGARVGGYRGHWNFWFWFWFKRANFSFLITSFINCCRIYPVLICLGPPIDRSTRIRTLRLCELLCKREQKETRDNVNYFHTVCNFPMFPARELSKFKGSSNDGTMVPGMGSTTTVRYLPRYYSIIPCDPRPGIG